MGEKAFVVFSYSRAQALVDGVLVALDEKLCKEVGFKVPIAMTAEAHAAAVSTSEEETAFGQDATGRLWDVLNVLRVSVAGSGHLDEVAFHVVVSRPGGEERVDLKAVIGPGDDAEAVMTIMLPEQD